MPLDMGPIQFQIVGTFMEKPKLLLNGEDVPYASLYASYIPEESFEYEEDGKIEKEVYPEQTVLSFSLSSQIGQLEANVNYRVKANVQGKFVLAKEDKPMPPWMKDKKNKKESPKEMKKDEPEKKEEAKKDKAKCEIQNVRIVEDVLLDKNPLRNEILKNLVAENE